MKPYIIGLAAVGRRVRNNISLLTFLYYKDLVPLKSLD